MTSRAEPALPDPLAKVLVAILVLGSAVSMSLGRIWGISLTGDRLVGLGAVVLLVVAVVGGHVGWTRVHVALGLFVAVQVLTTALNARQWPRGLLLVTVYVLGFACFALTVRVASRAAIRRFATQLLIAVGAAVGFTAGVLGVIANLWVPLWGTAKLPVGGPADAPAFAASATFVEANLMGSFLLIPLALSLWTMRGGWLGLLGIVTGLAFSFTRAAWVGMGGLVTTWGWTRRPPRRTALTLLGAMVLIFAIHGATTGRLAIVERTVAPALTGSDETLKFRGRTNRAMLRSWKARPLVGHGAGAGSRIGARPDQPGRHWAGNLEVHLLQNSGLLGLSAFVFVVIVLVREVLAARHRRDEGWTARGVPLAAAGVCLLFTYQFTHGLWVMYPYVYLGLLTAELHATEESP
jgi:O-antigen ligase